MKFITGSFSNLMFLGDKNILLREELDEEQFLHEIQDGYSCVGAKDICDRLGIARNKEPVKARPGDIIYNVAYDGGQYKYFRVQVMPSTLPCNKEYCEELI